MAPQRSRLLMPSGPALLSCPSTRLGFASVLFGALLASAPLLAGSTITVTTAADSGAGSLREAIDTANSDSVPTTITFAGGLAGGTIFPLSQLPDLTENDTTIDGDIGADCDPDIAIDGSSAGPGADGLALTSNGHTIRGLAFFDFDGDGLEVRGSSNVVECSYFGTNLALASGHGNGEHGITIRSGGNNVVGLGNVAAYNALDGVNVTESSDTGYPEFTSLTPDHTSIFSTVDFSDGCDHFAMVGGGEILDTGGRPFIENFGMRLTGSVGVSTPGTYTFEIQNLDDQARLTVDGSELLDVGGGDPPPLEASIALAGGESVRLDYAEGGGAANVRLVVTGPGTATFSTDGNLGGCATGQPGLCGDLYQLRIPNEGNTITQSSIYGNGETGIALNCCCGTTFNDAGDADIGANTLLNYPVITGVAYAGTPGSYTVSGTAPASSTVELFLSDGDPSGFGEGKTYLTSAIATGGGTFSGAAVLDPGAPLTPSATDSFGNTSEFGPNFSAGDGLDEATVGTNSGLPGTSFEIPISVRDLSLTALGRDRPAGDKIQSLSFKVVYSPTGSFSSITAARAGITAALSPAFQSTPSTANSISYIGQFNETTNLIPFVLDAAAPGDQVAKLTVTIGAAAPAGTVSLTLDTVATSLANFAGSIEETTANSRLALTNGSITVLSNAAQGLFATAESSSTIRLRWGDPNQNETGFRIERSLDASSWSTVTTVGANATSFLDTGRAAATLYYYRLVTLIAPSSTSSQISNTGFATTFPAAAAKVCVQRMPGNDATWARYPSPAWNDVDNEWAVAWQAREDGIQSDIYFQRFDSTSLDPIGDPVNVSQNDMNSQYPTLVWNGSRYLVHWWEGKRREAGPLSLAPAIGTFALLEANGDIVRNGVVPPVSSLRTSIRDDAKMPLSWDGTHWGLLTMEVPTTHPFTDLYYRRLTESGDVVMPPLPIAPTPDHSEIPDLAYNVDRSSHGVAWTSRLDDSVTAYFQRLDESTGAVLGSQQSLGGSYSGSYGISTIENGLDGWAVAWSEIATGGSDYATYFRKVDANGVPLGPDKVRLSDAAPSLDFNASLHKRPDGGFVVFSNGYGPSGYNYEVVRAEATSSGAKDGPVVVISPDDGVSAYLPAVAETEDGSRFLVVWNESDPSGSPNGLEVSGLLVDADGLSAPGPKVDLTTGHTPSSNFLTPGTGVIGVRALGAGFVALWTDPANPGEIRGRSWDGAGTIVHDFLPLNSAPLAGSAAVVSVGNTFAVLWRTAANDYRFARYDADGLIVGEIGISSAAGNGALELGFDGENYAALIRSGSNYLFQRIDPDGNVVGSESTTLGSAGSAPRFIWTGGGWAVLWRGPNSAPNLNFGFLAQDGTVVTPPTAVVTPVVPQQFTMAWSGTELGVAWTERRSTDTVPAQDIYFNRLNLNGTKALPEPEVAVVSSPYNDTAPSLYWADGEFRLTHVHGTTGAFREIAIDPVTGAVIPGERFWSNRQAGTGIAWNGVTLGMLLATHFQTSACLDDPSPPPCPALSVASVDNLVRLTWPAVADPDSGIWRYQVLRRNALPASPDEVHLAELDPDTLQFDDAGYEIGRRYEYELLAMNGAYNESDGCTPVPFSTTAGDANGNGSFEIADLFYLINFFFGDGEPPAGDADANGDGVVTVADLFYLINHFFSGGPPPI